MKLRKSTWLSTPVNASRNAPLILMLCSGSEESVSHGCTVPHGREVAVIEEISSLGEHSVYTPNPPFHRVYPGK